MSGDDNEIEIKDIDYDINEREKARELGVELPDAPVTGLGNVEPEMDDEDIEEDEEDIIADNIDGEIDEGFEE